MAVVNFTVTKPFEKKVTQAIRDHGFSSRAEFFRFAALSFLHVMNLPGGDIDREYETVMNDLSATLTRKFKNKKIPSLEEQLSDLR